MEENKLWHIGGCIFKKEENGEWEAGLILSEGDCGILDRKGEKVEEVYDYKKISSDLSLNVSIIFNELGKKI